MKPTLNMIENSDHIWIMNDSIPYSNETYKSNWTTWFKRVFVSKLGINTSTGRILLIFNILVIFIVLMIVWTFVATIGKVVKWIND